MPAGVEVPRSLNVDALLERPDRGDVARFWPDFRAGHPRLGDTRARVRRVILRIGAAAGGIGTLTMVFGTSRALSGGAQRSPEQVINMLMVGVLVVIAFSVLLWAALRTSGRRTSPRQHWALARFAADNGFVYAPEPVVGGLEEWRHRGRLVVARAMRTVAPGGRTIEWADYELRRSSRASTHTQFGGWIAVQLGRPLPHIVVRATGRGSRMLSTAAVPDESQRLSLEGDFDRYFTLYCPAGYERDALYLFTPDVMATAVDDAGGWDIEIVDDVLLLVRPRDVVTVDPAEWMRLVRTAEAFARQVDHWERWRDEKAVVVARPGSGREAGTAVVARRGRRLRTRWSAATWVWIVFAALLVAAVVLGGSL